MATKVHQVTVIGHRHSLHGVPTKVIASFTVTTSELRKLRSRKIANIQSHSIKLWTAEDIIDEMGILPQGETS